MVFRTSKYIREVFSSMLKERHDFKDLMILPQYFMAKGEVVITSC